MIKFFLLFHQYQESFKDFYWGKKDSVVTTKHLDPRIVNTPQIHQPAQHAHICTCFCSNLSAEYFLKLPRQHCMVIPCGFLSELVETTDFESLMIERIDVNHPWVAVPTTASFILHGFFFHPCLQ
jgi:hypothetical protein